MATDFGSNFEAMSCEDIVIYHKYLFRVIFFGICCCGVGPKRVSLKTIELKFDLLNFEAAEPVVLVFLTLIFNLGVRSSSYSKPLSFLEFCFCRYVFLNDKMDTPKTNFYTAGGSDV